MSAGKCQVIQLRAGVSFLLFHALGVTQGKGLFVAGVFRGNLSVGQWDQHSCGFSIRKDIFMDKKNS